MRGVSLITALGVVAELGGISRFDRPERLMSYAGLVPSEYSSGPTRHQPRVGTTLRKRQGGLPEEVKRIAWKAQMRLSHKFCRLVGRAKPANKAVVAVARELLGFVWDIARQVRAQQLTQAGD